MEILGKYREEGHDVVASISHKPHQVRGASSKTVKHIIMSLRCHRSGGVKMQAIHFLATSLLLFWSLTIFAQTNYTVQQDAFSKSYSYESRGNFTDAISAMKTVYQEDSYEINLRLGWVEYLAGQFTESSAYYQKAIKLKPYAIEAKIGFANPASALGNWDQVITQYNDVLAIDPQNTTVNYRMGSIYYGRKDYEKAEKYLEKVVNLYGFDYDSMVLYAWTNYRLGKVREAQVLFNKALLIRPKDASATEGLGLIK